MLQIAAIREIFRQLAAEQAQHSDVKTWLLEGAELPAFVLGDLARKFKEGLK